MSLADNQGVPAIIRPPSCGPFICSLTPTCKSWRLAFSSTGVIFQSLMILIEAAALLSHELEGCGWLLGGDFEAEWMWRSLVADG